MQERPSADQAVASQDAASTTREQTKLAAMVAAAVATQKKDPYAGLFRGQPSVSVYDFSGTMSGVPNPRVVCGLTVLQVDPAIDPKMVRLEPDAGIDFKIHRVTPLLCND
jgi:hypothetical protein